MMIIRVLKLPIGWIILSSYFSREITGFIGRSWRKRENRVESCFRALSDTLASNWIRFQIYLFDYIHHANCRTLFQILLRKWGRTLSSSRHFSRQVQRRRLNLVRLTRITDHACCCCRRSLSPDGMRSESSWLDPTFHCCRWVGEEDDPLVNPGGRPDQILKKKKRTSGHFRLFIKMGCTFIRKRSNCNDLTDLNSRSQKILAKLANIHKK